MRLFHSAFGQTSDSSLVIWFKISVIGQSIIMIGELGTWKVTWIPGKWAGYLESEDRRGALTSAVQANSLCLLLLNSRAAIVIWRSTIPYCQTGRTGQDPEEWTEGKDSAFQNIFLSNFPSCLHKCHCLSQTRKLGPHRRQSGLGIGVSERPGPVGDPRRNRRRANSE